MLGFDEMAASSEEAAYSDDLNKLFCIWFLGLLGNVDKFMFFFNE